jgi:hypothetical protein
MIGDVNFFKSIMRLISSSQLMKYELKNFPNMSDELLKKMEVHLTTIDTTRKL